MATQSAVLGYNFGIGYEMGKRTIKAMNNDFFNKLVTGSPDKITVLSQGQEFDMPYNQYISFITKRHGQEQIDTFEKMIPSFMTLQDTIIEKSVEIEMLKANRTPSAVVEIWQAYKDGIRGVGADARFNFDKLITAIFGGIFNKDADGPTTGDERRGGDPFQKEEDKESEPKDDGERFDKTEPDPLPTGSTPEGKAPEPAALIQSFKIKVSTPLFGLWELNETHTKTDWDKIIRFYHGQANRESSINDTYHIIWRALRKAYLFFYGHESGTQ